jgi:hypothetical protein
MAEDIYYDQTPITLEFSVEEHDLLIHILNHAIDGMDLAIPFIYDLNGDSEIRQRYEMINNMKERSWKLWRQRFKKDSVV